MITAWFRDQLCVNPLTWSGCHTARNSSVYTPLRNILRPLNFDRIASRRLCPHATCYARGVRKEGGLDEA
eukprot:3937870-Rhodomonas_salina.1